MILPYYLRLLCLCLATFFVVHVMLWLGVRAVSGAVVRVAENMRPRSASRFLFALRLAPAVASLFVVVGFCVPSYVWLEPNLAVERVGWVCLLAAVLGAAGWTASLWRGLAALGRTRQFVRRSETASAPASDLLVVESPTAVMALAGVFRPRLVVSQRVLQALSSEQQEAAFRHEAAHRTSRDNLKKLAVLLTPDALPWLGGLGRLERAWARFTEWAADDEAVDGDQQRALSLASALVLVAKLGVSPVPAYLLVTLLDDDSDLKLRVDRLLREPACAEKPLAPQVAIGRNLTVVAGSVAVTLLLWPESLGGVHRLLERLVQ